MFGIGSSVASSISASAKGRQFASGLFGFGPQTFRFLRQAS